MKKLVSVVLALSLLGGSAAVAAPYDHGGQGYNSSYSNQDRGDNYRGRDNNGGEIVAGVGILALAAILASQHRDHRHHGWNNRDDRGYGNQYGEHRDGYGERGHR